MKLRHCILALSTTVLCSGSFAVGQTGEAHGFDLGVAKVEVVEKGASTMFRRVRVRCVVVNHGPGRAPAKVRILLTRPNGNGDKVVHSLVTKYGVPPGATFYMAAEDTIWHAAIPPYRCAIDYGPPGALRVIGDNNASNDVGQSTQTK